MDDVVIVAAKRTPFGKAWRGSFKEKKEDFLLYNVIKGALEESGVNPENIQDIVVGNVLSPKSAMISRMVCLDLGIRQDVPVLIVNRQCISGLEAVNLIAQKIKNREINIGLACGYENMTRYSMIDSFEVECAVRPDCLMSMGMTSETLCQRFAYTREELDNFACKSQNRAYEYQNEFPEIVPIKVGDSYIKTDDGIRQSTIEGLSKLKPCFQENGLSTAGNSSQITDGAAAVILTSRQYALENGLKILARFVDYVTVGADPAIMGEGPALAIPLLLSRNQLKINDIHVYEINEAFASTIIHSMKVLNIDVEKINPKGGAIALGHPLGASGCRLIGTIIHELPKGKSGIVSLCAAGGMGAAALIIRE